MAQLHADAAVQLIWVVAPVGVLVLATPRARPAVASQSELWSLPGVTVGGVGLIPKKAVSKTRSWPSVETLTLMFWVVPVAVAGVSTGSDWLTPAKLAAQTTTPFATVPEKATDTVPDTPLGGASS